MSEVREMGREVRRVPAGWQHPKNEEGQYIALLAADYEADLKDWMEQKQHWDAGERSDFEGGWTPRVGEELTMPFHRWHGQCPDREEYMPIFPPGTATHLMMYETTSEGTPISPAFATPEELAHWLADNGASAFGDMTATYEEWLATCKRGSAVSAVLSDNGMESGVAAEARLE